MFGDPRLAAVVNVLDDFMKVVGGSAEVFWLNANRGMHIDIDKEMQLEPNDEADLTSEIEEYTHQLRRIIRTRGVKITNLGSDPADPSGVFKTLCCMVSAMTGIPQRILFGNEAGQLASEQDRAMWADRINERRKSHASPIILMQFIKKCQQFGALPEAQDLKVTWPDAFSMSPLEVAQASAQRARAVASFITQGAGGKQIVTTVEEARELSGLPRDIPTSDTKFEQIQVKPMENGRRSTDNAAPDELTGNGNATGTGSKDVQNRN
jgi:hypothetical protein